MELFVVNRLEEEEAENVEGSQEKEKLDKVLQKIERNKKLRLKQKEKQKQQKELQRKIKSQAIEERKLRKKLKADIIKPPEVDEFIDQRIVEEAPEQTEQEVPEKIPLEGFTILGGEQFEKKAKVNRVLPRWLTTPKIISADLKNLQTKVSSMKELNRNLQEKLKSQDVKYFFPVQSEVIPWLLNANKIKNCIQPNDVCVSAPTGSGKTLAFVLPIVQALENHVTKQIRALVILPTQDLALQVFRTFKKFTADTDIDVCIITGRSPFAQEQKQLISESKAFGYLCKVDILVCTAGRLVDHLKNSPGFTLEYLEFLVIDEADRVLDNVQNDWLYHLEKHIYKKGSSNVGSRMLNLNTLQKQRPPQKLLFSATLSQDPEKLQKLGLFQPKLFTSIVDGTLEDVISDRFIGKYTTPKELTEKFIVCSMDLKPLVLYEYLKSADLRKTIVFTHSLDSTHRLKVLLQSLFKSERNVEEISSNLEAKVRSNLIDNFERGLIDILVCTDALARGIDLPNIKCVISYSAPKHIKTYIHRAGRTARAGEDGLAVTLVHKTQVFKFQSLLKQAAKTNLEEIKIDEAVLEPLVEQYKEALSDLKKTVDEEEEKDLKKIKTAKKFRRADKRKRE